MKDIYCRALVSLKRVGVLYRRDVMRSHIIRPFYQTKPLTSIRYTTHSRAYLRAAICMFLSEFIISKSPRIFSLADHSWWLKARHNIYHYWIEKLHQYIIHFITYLSCFSAVLSWESLWIHMDMIIRKALFMLRQKTLTSDVVINQNIKKTV